MYRQGPLPLGAGKDGLPNLIPDQIVEGVSAKVVANGYDALRRLGRLDLARHYPELGVTDVCAGK